MPACWQAAANPPSGDRHGLALTSRIHGSPRSSTRKSTRAHPASPNACQHRRASCSSRASSAPSAPPVREASHGVPVLERSLAPLGVVADDLRLVGGVVDEDDLGGRQDLRAPRPRQHGEVELAAVHEPFGEPSRAQRRGDLGGRLRTCDAAVVQADRRMFPYGLHDPVAPCAVVAVRTTVGDPRGRGQSGRRHALLRQQLVRGQVQCVRRATGEREAVRLPQRGREVQQPARAVERLDQVEHRVRDLERELAPQVAQVRRAGQDGDRVAQRLQRRADGGDLVEHVALVGRRVGRNELVDDRDAHQAGLRASRSAAEAMMRPTNSS